MRPYRSTRAALMQLCSKMLAVLCVVGLLGTQLHHVIVRHVTCLEHGELIHSDPHGSYGTASGWPELRLLEASSSIVAGADTAKHEHEHCGVVSQRFQCQRDATHSVGVLQLALVIRQLPEAQQAYPIDIVLLAPKTSPPV